MDNTRDDECGKLFLLEVFVNELYISHPNLSPGLEDSLKDTCVLFQFLHYPPLVVCQSDFIGYASGRIGTTQIIFKSGKSCFFSLRVPKGPVLPTPFNISVSVVYKLKENMLPNKLEVGKTTIEMGNSFTQLLSTNDNCDSLPSSKVETGTFELKDEAGKTVGGLKAFIRLSCFGKIVITQFSLNKENENAYLFKGTDVKQYCRDEAPRNGKMNERTSFHEVDNSNNEKEHSPSDAMFMENKQYKTYSPTQGKYLQSELQPHGNDVFNGTKSQLPPTVHPFTSFGPSVEQSQLNWAKCANLCGYPSSRPQNSMSKDIVKPQTDMSLAPGQVGIQDDQVIFQLPIKRPGDSSTKCDKESPLCYKLRSSEMTPDGRQKNAVVIKSDDMPELAGENTVGPVSGLPINDDHDVFLLKLGQKCNDDKKRNIELELRVPRVKETKLETVNQETQCLESDFPKEEVDQKPAKVVKGKGKGKKGKK